MREGGRSFFWIWRVRAGESGSDGLVSMESVGAEQDVLAIAGCTRKKEVWPLGCEGEKIERGGWWRGDIQETGRTWDEKGSGDHLDRPRGRRVAKDQNAAGGGGACWLVRVTGQDPPDSTHSNLQGYLGTGGLVAQLTQSGSLFSTGGGDATKQPNSCQGRGWYPGIPRLYVPAVPSLLYLDVSGTTVPVRALAVPKRQWAAQHSGWQPGQMAPDTYLGT